VVELGDEDVGASAAAQGAQVEAQREVTREVDVAGERLGADGVHVGGRVIDAERGVERGVIAHDLAPAGAGLVPGELEARGGGDELAHGEAEAVRIKLAIQHSADGDPQRGDLAREPREQRLYSGGAQSWDQAWTTGFHSFLASIMWSMRWAGAWPRHQMRSWGRLTPGRMAAGR
jgi:hypothetical protein